MGTPSPIPARRLWAAVLCGYLSLGTTIQALPLYVTDHFHGGSLAAGTAVGVAFAATAVARPFAGRAADAGRARPVVIAGGLLGALGGLGHLVAPDFGVLLLARLVMGAGEAALFSGAIPWILADTPAERRGRTAGWFGLSMWGGLAGGPVIADLLDAWLGFDGVWTGVIALGIVSAALVVLTPSQPRSPERPSLLPSTWRDIVPAGASLPGSVLGMAAYGYGTISAMLILYLRHGSFGGERAALAIFAAAFLLTRALGSPLVDLWGGERVAWRSLAVEAVGLLLITVAPQGWIALAGGALTGAGVALMYPSTVAITLRRCGSLRPGTSVGAMTSFWDLGVMVAGPVGGVVAGGKDYPASFAIAAAISLAALGIVVTALRPRARRTRPRDPVVTGTRSS